MPRDSRERVAKVARTSLVFIFDEVPNRSGDVNGEMLVVLTGCYQIRRLADSLGALSIEHMKFLIGGRGCFLTRARARIWADSRVAPKSGSYDRALSLCTVECVGGHANFAMVSCSIAVFNIFSHKL